MNTEACVEVGDYRCGPGNPLLVIAGPCVIESEQLCHDIAKVLVEINQSLPVNIVFKASFDKANRTSASSKRGPGLRDGLEILRSVKAVSGLPVTTDIHLPEQAGAVAEVCDMLQIPAFLCRQTDLLVSAARTGRVVNVKKGQFLAPWDMKHVVDKVESAGSKSLMLTERGTSFGYNTLVSDMRSLPALREFGYPVVYDATHSVQMPGGLGGSSGGQREMVPHLLRAAVAVGCDAIFVETHPSPDEAPSDGPNMVPLEELENLLQGILQMDAARRSVDGI